MCDHQTRLLSKLSSLNILFFTGSSVSILLNTLFLIIESKKLIIIGQIKIMELLPRHDNIIQDHSISSSAIDNPEAVSKISTLSKICYNGQRSPNQNQLKYEAIGSQNVFFHQEIRRMKSIHRVPYSRGKIFGDTKMQVSQKNTTRRSMGPITVSCGKKKNQEGRMRKFSVANQVYQVMPFQASIFQSFSLIDAEEESRFYDKQGNNKEESSKEIETEIFEFKQQPKPVIINSQKRFKLPNLKPEAYANFTIILALIIVIIRMV